MKVLAHIIFLTILIGFSSFSQSGDVLTVKYNNETGKSIFIIQTDYDHDSIISTLSYTMNVGGYRVTTTESIRKDFIIIDIDNNDTISRTTVLIDDLKLGFISFNIGEETLLPPIELKPKLRVKSKKSGGFQSIYNKGSVISFKTKNGEKYSGKIQGYNKNTLLISEESGTIKSVSFSEIKSIEICYPLITFGVWALFQGHCRNYSAKKINIHLVQQEYNSKRDYWDWHKIK